MTSPASPKDTAPEQPQPPLDLDQDPSGSTETTQDTPEPSEKHIDDDGFEDFGTTQDTLESSGGAQDEDDGFGDFGSSVSAFKGSADDDDEFGDFGATSAPITTGDDDDGFGDFGEVQGGDDDFGDFNDFADGDGFQDSGDFGDFEAGDGSEDPFGSSEPVAEPTPVPVVEEEPVEIAPDFNAVNSRQVENYVLEKLATLYPLSKDNDNTSTLLNTDLDDLDVSSVLSDQELWATLCEQSFQGKNSKSASSAPQFQWKHSQLRKEYYASLGLAVVKEPTHTSTASAIPSSVLSPASSSKSRVSSPMIVSTETMAVRKPLDLEATLAFCQFNKENLGGYSGDEMKDIIAQLTELTRQASDELTYWLDQREQMMMDSERYNEMIASLVGRAAKLKDAESKQGAKSKRLTRSSFNLK
ncbi:hypothetical protein BGZ74_000687 [Mortierella antarctica]|nr:hypothetical protein BGZ74_000687 [Mortierella antarctica]